MTYKQLQFTIEEVTGKKLEIYRIVDLDDSKGSESTLQIRVYKADENVINGNIKYINEEAEYSMKQANYTPVIAHSYDDDCIRIIWDEIGKFL